MSKHGSRTVLFAFLGVVSVGVAFGPLTALLRDTRQSEYYSHIALIPVVSLFFLFRRRRELFRVTGALFYPGIILMAAGAGLSLWSRVGPLDQLGKASVATVAGVVLLGGSYFSLFGTGALRKALFPLTFLAFAVPLPAAWMEWIIRALVTASTAGTRIFFEALRVPFAQEGSTFHLPGFSIVVADECSGIRSSLALLVTTVLAGHLFLRKFWQQAVLAAVVFPVAVFKNCVRIVTLYLLSYFVDMRIIEGGFLHKSGGFIFFGLGLVILGLLLWLLQEVAKGKLPAKSI
jgi:exosortase